MSSKLEKIYSVMPVSVQNLMVSVKGWTLNRKRYAKKYHEYLDYLMRSQWFSAKQFRDLQTAELRKLLREAIQNVPYYRETLSKFSSKIDAITVETMNELPLLEKSLLRENTEPFINKERLKYGYTEGHTSGTSGSPMVWPFDWDSMQYLTALRERQYRWAGTTTKAKSARFSGKLLLGKHDHAPYYRYNISEKQWLFSTYHLSSKTVPVYYEALRKINVAFIDGYPSALFTIASYINEHGQSGSWRPWMVNTTAETLMDFQREEIEKAFGCKIFNHYSSSEGAPFVTECMAGNMHLNPESGIIEFLRADGNPAEPGEDAEMVITSFFQRTMPIIRYRIGDRGTFAQDQRCPCGRQMPIVRYIAGRESDTLHTSERGSVGSAGFYGVFCRIPSRLKESQIEQVGKDSFLFRYVPLNEPLTKNEESVVIEEFKERLGSSVIIDLQVVEQIPKGPNGKSRLVIGLKKDK